MSGDSYQPFFDASLKRSPDGVRTALVAVGAALIGSAATYASVSRAQTTAAFVAPTQQLTAKTAQHYVGLKESELPHKWALSMTPPMDQQMNRGDCWLFATTAMLEDNYKRRAPDICRL